MLSEGKGAMLRCVCLLIALAHIFGVYPLQVQDGMGFSGTTFGLVTRPRIPSTSVLSQWPSQITSSTAAKFVGGVFDGANIWLVPHDATAVVRIAANGTMTAFSNWPGGATVVAPRFCGGVYSQGVVWLVPYASSHAVKLNATTTTMTLGPPVGTNYYCGGATNGRGSMWLTPFTASSSLAIVNTTSNTLTTTAAVMGQVCGGAVYDGATLWLPSCSTSPVLTRFNTISAVVVTLSFPASVSLGSSPFCGGVFDGQNVWLMPFSADSVVRVRSNDSAMTSFSNWPSGFAKGATSFCGGAFDGRSVWMLPYRADRIVRVDTLSGGMFSFVNWPVSFSLVGGDFYGGVFDGSSIWGIPYGANSVLKITIFNLTATATESEAITASSSASPSSSMSAELSLSLSAVTSPSLASSSNSLTMSFRSATSSKALTASSSASPSSSMSAELSLSLSAVMPPMLASRTNSPTASSLSPSSEMSLSPSAVSSPSLASSSNSLTMSFRSVTSSKALTASLSMSSEISPSSLPSSVPSRLPLSSSFSKVYSASLSDSESQSSTLGQSLSISLLNEHSSSLCVSVTPRSPTPTFSGEYVSLSFSSQSTRVSQHRVVRTLSQHRTLLSSSRENAGSLSLTSQSSTLLISMSLAAQEHPPKSRQVTATVSVVQLIEREAQSHVTAVEKSSQSVTAATSVASLLSGADVSTANMQALLSALTCTDIDEASAANPAMYVISPFFSLGWAAMTFGNIGLMGGVSLVHWGLATLHACLFGSGSLSWKSLRFPSYSFKFVELLLPGVIYGSMFLVASPSSAAGSVVLGALGFMGALALIAFWQFVVVRFVVPPSEWIPNDRDAASYPFTWRVIPSGRWGPSHHSKMFGTMFASLCPSWRRFRVAELGLSVLNACLASFGAAIRSKEVCRISVIVLIILHVVACGLTAYCRPFRSPTDCFVVPVNYFILALCCICIVLEVKVSVYLSLLQSMLMIVKAAVAIIVMQIEQSQHLRLALESSSAKLAGESNSLSDDVELLPCCEPLNGPGGDGVAPSTDSVQISCTEASGPSNTVAPCETIIREHSSSIAVKIASTRTSRDHLDEDDDFEEHLRDDSTLHNYIFSKLLERTEAIAKAETGRDHFLMSDDEL